MQIKNNYPEPRHIKVSTEITQHYLEGELADILREEIDKQMKLEYGNDLKAEQDARIIQEIIKLAQETQIEKN